MRKPLRFGFLGLTLAAGVPAALISSPAIAQQQQGSLHLRKAKFHMDDAGQVWLQVQFDNKGTKPIRVVGVSPNRAGPWSPVGQTVEPDGRVKGELKVQKDPPTVVWVNCSEGLLRFELPKRQ